MTTLTPIKQAYLHLGSGAAAAQCKDGAVIKTALTPLICKCPQFDYDIAPCFCRVTPPLSTSTTLTITCDPLNVVDDTRMAAIITKTPATTPIDTLILKVNNLTQVPANLNQYTQLTYLSLAHNSISSIAVTGTIFPAVLSTLDVNSNQLTQVPTGLNQYTALSTLLLASNSIGSFDVTSTTFPHALATLDLRTQYTGLVSVSLASNHITSVATTDLKFTGSVQLMGSK